MKNINPERIRWWKFLLPCAMQGTSLLDLRNHLSLEKDTPAPRI
jgi:hypothetical protein